MCIHLKLLHRTVSGAWFLTGGVFECDIAHHRSVAVLCMLYKIRCNPTHPLNGALPEPYMPVWVTCCTLVAHRYTYAPPRCGPHRTAGLLSLSPCLSGMICCPCIRSCGTCGFQEWGQCFLVGLSCSIPTRVFYYFSFSLLSVYRLVL